MDQSLSEKSWNGMSGWPVVAAIAAALGYIIWAVIRLVEAFDPWFLAVPIGVGVAVFFAVMGFFIVDPKETRVLMLYGHYFGTARRPGLRWTLPVFAQLRVSVRVRNFETQLVKVNDKSGNPVMAAAIVVWRVADTAQALFEVQNYEKFVKTQSESALRSLIMRYPYESFDPLDRHEGEAEVALITHTVEVSDELKLETQNRLNRSGIEVLEARISHLAYAAEIAPAMLQRQQAGAIIAARKLIVEGAVGMVEDALAMLGEREVVTLSDESKAQMAASLLVVLCSDRNAQPVLDIQAKAKSQ